MCCAVERRVRHNFYFQRGAEGQERTSYRFCDLWASDSIDPACQPETEHPPRKNPIPLPGLCGENRPPSPGIGCPLMNI